MFFNSATLITMLTSKFGEPLSEYLHSILDTVLMRAHGQCSSMTMPQTHSTNRATTIQTTDHSRQEATSTIPFNHMDCNNLLLTLMHFLQIQTTKKNSNQTITIHALTVTTMLLPWLRPS